jgi:hypothetical protein
LSIKANFSMTNTNNVCEQQQDVNTDTSAVA